MWDEVDWGASAGAMAGEREKEEERQRKGEDELGRRAGEGQEDGWRREEESGEKMRTNDDKRRRAPGRPPLASQLFDLISHVSRAGPDTRNRAVARKYVHLVFLDKPLNPRPAASGRHASGSLPAAASGRALPSPARTRASLESAAGSANFPPPASRRATAPPRQPTPSAAPARRCTLSRPPLRFVRATAAAFTLLHAHRTPRN